MDTLVYKNEEIKKITLEESTIVSINWINENGIDLELNIDWCGQEDLKHKVDFLNVQSKLLFKFVSDIDFCFKHSEEYTIGALEITDFKYQKIGKRYSVEFLFDFQPVGHIRFNCDNFKFIVE